MKKSVLKGCVLALLLGATNQVLAVNNVTDMVATAISCNEVKLSWSDSSGETAYRIRRKVKGEAAFSNLGDVAANVTTFSDNTVQAGVTYIYQVRPVVNNTAVAVSNNPELDVPFCGSTNCDVWFSSNGVWKGKGRIAISSDGNEHDKDDWAATPFTLALLAAKGLQDKMVLYTFSDHIWGSNNDYSDATQQMRTSALGGADRFGFDRTRFVEAVSNPTFAYNRMADEINASTAQNPLFIIAAGPMQVVGEALNRANVSALPYVTVLSHSTWNDRHSDKPSSWENHSGWTWDEMVSKFQSKGVTFNHIVDQNGGSGYDGMRASMSKFSWLNTSSARNNEAYQSGSWEWLYQRQMTAKKGTEFDPSDAGLAIYLLTGKEKTDPSDAKIIMESPIESCSASLRFVSTEMNIESLPLSVYPTVVENILFINGVSESVVEVFRVSDGVLVLSEVINNATLDVSTLENGNYILKVNHAGKMDVLKFVKM